MKIGNIDIADIKLGASQVSAWFGGVLVWGGAEPVPTADWLCFTAEQASSTATLSAVGSPDAVSLETSEDGSSWSDYTVGDTLTLAAVGDKVYMRAKNENSTFSKDSSNYYKFAMTGTIAASGNIQSLLKADCSRTDAPSYCFSRFFQGCKSLVAAPDLPAAQISAYCYNYMFWGCTYLSAAPDLPATTLANNCYYCMFRGCSHLTSAPALSATTLAPQCCQEMFSNCTSLSAAPKLLATALANNCYRSMFSNSSHLSVVDVSFTSWLDAGNATTDWLNGVAASGTFACPEELSDVRGASNIPTDWTKVDNKYPTSNLLMHFDGIDNTGAGDASHSTDTQTWANVDGSLTGYYLKRPSTTYNTSWDSKGAVFTGAYDQAFWLTDPQGSTVSALSSVDTGSFTYALAFYYDPSTIEEWRGLIGRQGHNNSTYGYNSYAYVCTNPNPYGVKMNISFGKDGNVANEQSGPDLRSYLTENSFNTIAFAYDESADTLKSFVNGQLVDTTNLTSHPPYASDIAFVLGSGAQSTGDNRTCIGKIYDFMMYSEAITDAEVAKIHNWQSTRFNS